jgi:catechol-2,3-dioxygenase
VSLHRLTDITLGVPSVEQTAAYYTEFGLQPLSSSSAVDERSFGTVDGGQQLRIVYSPVRRLLSLGVATDDRDDLGRIAAALAGLDIPSQVDTERLATVEPATGLDVTVSIVPRLQQGTEPTPYNAPGDITRPNVRAPAVYRDGRVRPRKLGHVVIGSTDKQATQQFFTVGLGFKVSDELGDRAAFMRCSADHHNVLVQQAPVNFMHHTSWEVENVDEVGRGAHTMLAGHPERHVWGLGRHWVGSNFFYYLRDPAGNFSEYYSDMDEILDDQLWEPGVFGPEKDPNHWGPPMPASMIEPDDLAELMAGLH